MEKQIVLYCIVTVYTRILEYYSATKRNEFMIYTRLDLKIIVLNEKKR